MAGAGGRFAWGVGMEGGVGRGAGVRVRMRVTMDVRAVRVRGTAVLVRLVRRLLGGWLLMRLVWGRIGGPGGGVVTGWVRC